MVIETVLARLPNLRLPDDGEFAYTQAGIGIDRLTLCWDVP